MEKKPQKRHGLLHDPKLPVVHGQTVGNRAQEHICPSPIVQNTSQIEP